jgi:hypothetical protein
MQIDCRIHIGSYTDLLHLVSKRTRRMLLPFFSSLKGDFLADADYDMSITISMKAI